MIFPSIHTYSGASVALDTVKLHIVSELSQPLSVWFDEWAVPQDAQGNVTLYTKQDTMLSGTERYRLSVQKTQNGLDITVFYNSMRSLWHGAQTVIEMIRKNTFYTGLTEDYPSFQQRGFIEGFYGTPWTMEKRLDMLRLMSHNHMNTYYYAPKDVPYHREKWQMLYEKADLEELVRLVSFAQAHYMDFYYAVGPGLTVCYSSAEQFEQLKAKFRQLYEAGITCFGLFLDDIPSDLQYEADREQFAGLPQAHVYYINQVYRYLKTLDEHIKLTVCPYQYHGNGDEAYISELGRGLPEDIQIFWTGHNICSQELTVREAGVFMNHTGHKPLYWDNYPVNDAEMFMEMHLGPVAGREPNLGLYSEGLIANVMEYSACSKIPLMTIADYLWNSENYDQAQSWQNALQAVFGKDTPVAAYFTDHLVTSCLKQPNSSLMCDALGKASFYRNTGRKDEMIREIEQYTEKMLVCKAYLLSSTLPILQELERWIVKFCKCCDILECALQFFKTGDEHKRETLKELMQAYNESATVLTEFCLREFIEYTIERYEVIK